VLVLVYSKEEQPRNYIPTTQTIPSWKLLEELISAHIGGNFSNGLNIRFPRLA